jgi:hypothetical protein
VGVPLVTGAEVAGLELLCPKAKLPQNDHIARMTSSLIGDINMDDVGRMMKARYILERWVGRSELDIETKLKRVDRTKDRPRFLV